MDRSLRCQLKSCPLSPTHTTSFLSFSPISYCYHQSLRSFNVIFVSKYCGPLCHFPLVIFFSLSGRDALWCEHCVRKLPESRRDAGTSCYGSCLDCLCCGTHNDPGAIDGPPRLYNTTQLYWVVKNMSHINVLSSKLFVWSWDQGEPRSGGCPAIQPCGRWATLPCDSLLPPVCHGPLGWSLGVPAAYAGDQAVCPSGSVPAAPKAPFENARLRDAIAAATAWLAVPGWPEQGVREADHSVAESISL